MATDSTLKLTSATDNSALPGFQRARWPFCNSKAELDNRKRDIWRVYHSLVDTYERMVRAGGRWDDLSEVLNRAITRLSNDLLMLQANYVIDRGLRGEEAMRVFRDEALEILEVVTSEWRRLGVTVEDDAKEAKEREQPFHRVWADLRRLLYDLPAEAAGETAPARCPTCKQPNWDSPSQGVGRPPTSPANQRSSKRPATKRASRRKAPPKGK